MYDLEKDFLNLEKAEEPEIKLPAYVGLQKILKEMEITDHLTCPLRNLYARQEAS